MRCNSLIYVDTDKNTNNNKGEILLGLPFFEDHLLIFDAGQRQIGIARSQSRSENIQELPSTVMIYYAVAATIIFLIAFFSSKHMLHTSFK